MSNYPAPGDRLGFVCGPCENPADRSGIVLAVYANRWSNNNVMILMDSGNIEYSCGQYKRVGIGMYLIQPAKEVQQ